MKICNRLIVAAMGAAAIASPFIAGAREVPVVSVTTTPYLNGGVGEDEAAVMRSKADDFSMRITFAEGSDNDFTADVPVVIADARGNPIFALDHAGPLLYVMLPKGTYTVTAQVNDVAEVRHVTLDGAHAEDVVFHWNPPGDSETR